MHNVLYIHTYIYRERERQVTPPKFSQKFSPAARLAPS